MTDVSFRLANRVQLTTDGHAAYLRGEAGFGMDVDFAQLVKTYGSAPTPPGPYGPAECIGAKPIPIMGSPDPDHISTSYVEQSNLSIRMGNRRFSRLTNAFSKKIDNHIYMLALYFLHNTSAACTKRSACRLRWLLASIASFTTWNGSSG